MTSPHSLQNDQQARPVEDEDLTHYFCIHCYPLERGDSVALCGETLRGEYLGTGRGEDENMCVFCVFLSDDGCQNCGGLL